MSPTSNYELKFLAPRRRAAPARRWLQATCRPDPIFPESTVYTVYYDTATLASLSEKQNSDYLKTKVRLRWYRVGNRFSETAFVEIKLQCFRHQLLLSRPYLLLTNELTPSFGNERSCRRNNRQ